MSDFDELVSRHGVLVAGRLGPDGRIVAHKNSGLFIEDPAVFALMTSSPRQSKRCSTQWRLP